MCRLRLLLLHCNFKLYSTTVTSPWLTTVPVPLRQRQQGQQRGQRQRRTITTSSTTSTTTASVTRLTPNDEKKGWVAHWRVQRDAEGRRWRQDDEQGLRRIRVSSFRYVFLFFFILLLTFIYYYRSQIRKKGLEMPTDDENKRPRAGERDKTMNRGSCTCL